VGIIETENLTRRYGRAEALSGLSLSVPAGSSFAFLGPNGAGKTTTIKILMNLIAPTLGTARVLGVDSRSLRSAALAKIGYVSENQNLPPWMTVRQLADYCRPFYPTWDRDLEASLVRKFELPVDRPLRHLSRGVKMKAALLAALAYRPKLLVMDEPFSGLDPMVREEFVDGLREASRSSEWTIFVSSHDVEEVERLCDWVAVLDSGRLSYSESATSLLGRFRTVHVVRAPAGAAPAGSPGREDPDSVFRITEGAYAGEATLAGYRERYPGALVTAAPMTLREIFLSQARLKRKSRGTEP
jgi:ABC-2 type transport system ATP-binding protein